MALEWKKNSWKRYHVCIQGATSTTYNILYYMHVCDCMCMHLCTININEKKMKKQALPAWHHLQMATNWHQCVACNEDLFAEFLWVSYWFHMVSSGIFSGFHRRFLWVSYMDFLWTYSWQETALVRQIASWFVRCAFAWPCVSCREQSWRKTGLAMGQPAIESYIYIYINIEL